MNSLVTTSVVLLASFLATWYGTGLVVGSVVKISKLMRMSAFNVSFFLLGLLTSLPELTIGLSAIANDEPQIFVGNLIGGIIIIFLLIIPLLGAMGNGLKAPFRFSKKLLSFVLVVSFVPSLLAGDRQIDQWEGFLAICLYLLLVLFFSREQGLAERLTTSVRSGKVHWLTELIKIVFGITLITFASNQIVQSSLLLSEVFQIAPFFVGLIIVSLGTNIPEISLAFRSLWLKKQDVALADYLGSASVNTLLLGVLTLVNQSPVVIPNHFYHRIIFTVTGLIAFFFFLRSRNTLSRKESLALLSVYTLFIITELVFVA